MTFGRRTIPWLIFVAAALLATTAPAAEASKPAGLDAPTAAFLQKHCVRCHGMQKAEADLRLDKLETDLDRRDVFTRWHTIVERLRAGEMPPEDEPQPEASELKAVIDVLHGRLEAASERRRESGRVVLRRLNRVEYENTLRDLFAVDVNIKEMLPEDAIALGFDNVGSALNVSPVLMERYLEAIDAVITSAVTPPVPTPYSKESHELVDSLPSYFRSVYQRKDDIVIFRDGVPTFISKWRAREGGLYRFRVECEAYQSAVPIPMQILVGNFNTAAGSARVVGFFDVHPRKQWIEVEARLNKRETIKVLPMSLPKIYLKGDDYPIYPGVGLAVGTVECEGPLPETWPSESYRRVYGDADPKTAGLAEAEKILRSLLPRAFRRPTTDAELAPFVKLVEQSLAAGNTFDESLRGGIKLILCSPHFLYFNEHPGPLDDYALASRLSYFLWSTMPDDELMTVAGRGELKKPEVLRAQTERLLKDPRSQQFVENFCGQWLSLRDIDFTTPDPQLYPEFDTLLRWSMLQETHQFFADLLNHDLSVLNFIDSDFTFLNNRLAKHYGISNVDGVELRKVALKPEDHRGGVLGQAAVLKVTANGTTTSPVVRGVWVSDRILGKPIPPPPPNVPAIEPDIRGATTVREQLAKHREIESCAGCHSKIDPPGFALEAFDVIGGYRDKYRAVGTKEKVKLPPTNIDKWLAKPGYGFGPAVDAGDVLADGRKFADLAEFKRLLLADPDQTARTVAEKLLIYATGGGLEYADRDELERIVAASREAKYGLRSLVHEVVQSELFLSK